MRKVLLLMSLAMLGALMFAPAAMAQGVSPEAGTGNPYGCPDEAPFVATAAGDPGEGSLRCFATQAEADAYSSGGAPATASPDATAPSTPSATPSATPTATASATASASASVSALPETGGPVSVLALGSLALLVVSGIMAFGLMRRS